jgi:replication factor A1
MVPKGTLKPIRKDFNYLSNDWEIFLDKTSIVDLCTDEVSLFRTKSLILY